MKVHTPFKNIILNNFYKNIIEILLSRNIAISFVPQFVLWEISSFSLSSSSGRICLSPQHFLLPLSSTALLGELLLDLNLVEIFALLSSYTFLPIQSGKTNSEIHQETSKGKPKHVRKEEEKETKDSDKSGSRLTRIRLG